MLQDLPLALRALGRSPGLTAVIIISIALGTGANAAVYSAVDALLFRGPAGVQDPSTLVDVYTSQITSASYGDSSYPDFASIVSAHTGFIGIGAIEDRDEVQVRYGTNVGLARLSAVTPGFWDLLGVQPAAGDWRRPGVVISTTVWLVAAQLALSTIFLVGSVLLSRAVDSALQFDESAAAGSVAVASIEAYGGADYRDSATARLTQMPTVSVVGWVATPPLARTVRQVFRIERGAVREPVEIDVNYASPGYFRAVHEPIVEGRVFSAEDEAKGADAVIVNEALAQRYFPGRAVGRTLGDGMGHTVRIVGVAETRSYRALEGPPRPMVFYPMTRYGARAFSAIVRLRSYVDARIATSALRSEFEQSGTTRSLAVESFNEHLLRELAPDRLTSMLIAACGVLALALAVVGVYGVMADLVRRRTREIGLRLALGAGPLHIAAEVAGACAAPAMAGIVAGIGAVVLLARVARVFVFEVPPADVTTLALTTAGLAVVVLAAIAPPTVRALRVNPLSALRNI